LVERWLAKPNAKDPPSAVHDFVRARWDEHGLGAEALIGRFQEACESALGKEAELVLKEVAAPLLAKDRRLVEADRDAVVQAVREFDDILGQPTESSVLQRPGRLDEPLAARTELLTAEWQQKIDGFTLQLIECPEFRLAGAETAVRQGVGLVEQILTHHEPLVKELTGKALAGSERLHFLAANYASIFRGRRADSLLKELHELLSQYPKWRLQSLILRRVVYTFTGLRGFLSDQVRELGFYRLRLGELATLLQAPFVAEKSAEPANGMSLFPLGCESFEAAIQRATPSTSADDLADLDRGVQQQLEGQFGALRHICTTPSLSLRNVEIAMLTQAQAFVESRIEAASVVDIYLSRHPGARVAKGLRDAFDAARPLLADSTDDPVAVAALCVPSGASHALAPAWTTIAPDAAIVESTSPDDLVVVRCEPSSVEAALGHLGDAASEAYQQLLDTEHFTPHTRTDIAEWQGTTANF
jgi:hypothetical protein